MTGLKDIGITTFKGHVTSSMTSSFDPLKFGYSQVYTIAMMLPEISMKFQSVSPKIADA